MTIRVDTEGRNVTSLYGLHDETDRFISDEEYLAGCVGLPTITLTIYRDCLTPLVDTGFDSVEQAVSEGEWWQDMAICLGWKIEVDGSCVAESNTRNRI